MPDIKMTFASGAGDIAISNGDISTADDLSTAVLISLFSDARVSSSEGTAQGYPRGFWGDDVDDSDPYPTGSLLWTLEGKTIINQTIIDAKKFCEDALEWMIRDEIAKSIDVTVTRTGLESLEIGIVIHRSNDQTYRYYYNWQSTGAAF